jgi:hypothetical protein
LFGITLDEALSSMPAVELESLLANLPPTAQTVRHEMGADLHDWSHGLAYLNINTARLVDLLEAWLNHEYASWTADPDEVEKERRRRKHRGQKPPPMPLIEPVAARPTQVHDLLAEVHRQQLEEYGQLPKVISQQLSSSEWDRELDLD